MDIDSTSKSKQSVARGVQEGSSCNVNHWITGTTYLELGLISNSKDRFLLQSYPKRYAQGIAIGIYSLFAGLKVKKIYVQSLPVSRIST